jgi:hypothetical protein
MATVVIILFLIHPNLTEQTFKLFACMQIGDRDSDWYLLADLGVQCWESEHNTWVALVGVPMMIAYVVGIPALGFFLLHKNRHRFDHHAVRKKYGFLYDGYHLETYYWETCVFARKIMLLVLAVFLANSVHLQALLTILLVGVALVFQVQYKPFADDYMDRLELGSLCMSYITFFCAQFMFVKDIGEGFRNFSSLAILGVNFFFIGVTIYYFIRILRTKRAEEDAEDLKATQELALKYEAASDTLKKGKKTSSKVSPRDDPSDLPTPIKGNFALSDLRSPDDVSSRIIRGSSAVGQSKVQLGLGGVARTNSIEGSARMHVVAMEDDLNGPNTHATSGTDDNEGRNSEIGSSRSRNSKTGQTSSHEGKVSREGSKKVLIKRKSVKKKRAMSHKATVVVDPLEPEAPAAPVSTDGTGFKAAEPLTGGSEAAE